MKTYFVDSFTNQKFKGNPAAVCFPESDMDNQTMQDIAAEIGFSETAFVKKIADKNYSIKFFTPKKEIALCGHATLASANIIFNATTIENFQFITGHKVELKIRKAEGKIVMEFPVYDTRAMDVPRAMLNALGITDGALTRFNVENNTILIEIDNPITLANLQPDFSALLNSYQGINGVLVTARSHDADYDFHYRFFWPWAGTNEDPVTGAMQTFLTKYWAEKLNKTKLKAFQSSARTGRMSMELMQDKVLIYGEAVTVFEGEFKN